MKYTQNNIKPGDKIKIRSIDNESHWVIVDCYINNPNTGLTNLHCTGDYDNVFRISFDRIETTEREL